MVASGDYVMPLLVVSGMLDSLLDAQSYCSLWGNLSRLGAAARCVWGLSAVASEGIHRFWGIFEALGRCAARSCRFCSVGKPSAMSVITCSLPFATPEAHCGVPNTMARVAPLLLIVAIADTVGVRLPLLLVRDDELFRERCRVLALRPADVAMLWCVVLCLEVYLPV